jgi:hypothetical protein
MKLLAVIMMTLIAVTAWATIKGSPFQPHDDQRFDESEGLASGEIFVGDASGDRAEVALSGDATLAAGGALTIAAGAVDESMLAVPTADGLNAMRVARANLDCGVSDCSAGALGLGVTLPANALIYQSYWFTETQFVDGGAGTVALHCEDANNIFSAADITGNADGSIIAGIQTGVIATMTAGIAAACEITATIATAEQTAGVLTLYVHYVVHD